MHIYIIRHTKYHNPENIFPFRLPVYLSKEGRAHAHQIGEWLKKRKLSKLPIHTSPIVRCVQTAEILASYTNSFVTCDDRLIEVDNPTIQGTIQPAKDAWKLEEFHPDRETNLSVRQRMISIFEEKVKEQHDCILVSHGDPITTLYYHLQNKQLPEHLWSPANADKVIDKGEIVDIEINENEPMVLTRHTV
jgi:broad specificity phosphatase PhoE